MSNNEKVLILFHGEHIAYSPTVIQLYDELSKKYDVTITAEFPHNFNRQKLDNRKVLYHKFYHVKTRYFYWILFKIISLYSKEAKYFKRNNINYKQYFFRFKFIKNVIKRNKFKTIISVDIMNLLFCSILEVKTDFLSLELCVDEKYLPLINTKFIRSVLIQSKERYEYLFKENVIKTFFVQNAPNYVEINSKHTRKGLVYGGSAYDELGFYDCLNYLNNFPDECLTIQGAIMKKDRKRVANEYQNLIDEQRLIIKQTYLENNEVVPFLAEYEIGFCFYNFQVPVIRDNYFNYATAPSGKMFKYLAAGVPVVCSNIIGFKFINEFHCGITINTLEPDEIRNAINAIRSNYKFYVENAIKAAKYYSFDKLVEPYLKLVDEIN
jgi:hypothetical protein